MFFSVLLHRQIVFKVSQKLWPLHIAGQRVAKDRKVGGKFEMFFLRSCYIVFCTLYKREDWVKRLGGKAYAESIVERYNYNVTWIETGDANMRQFYSHP